VKFIIIDYCQREHAVVHLVGDTALEAEISRVRFPIVPFTCFIEFIPSGPESSQPLAEMSTRIIS
jgi:hypothetical protein